MTSGSVGECCVPAPTVQAALLAYLRQGEEAQPYLETVLGARLACSLYKVSHWLVPWDQVSSSRASARRTSTRLPGLRLPWPSLNGSRWGELFRYEEREVACQGGVKEQHDDPVPRNIPEPPKPKPRRRWPGRSRSSNRRLKLSSHKENFIRAV